MLLSLSGIAQEGNIGCLFCFIQIDADDDTPENEFIVELIELVKNAPCMRNKPKIYIIQVRSVCL